MFSTVCDVIVLTSAIIYRHEGERGFFAVPSARGGDVPNARCMCGFLWRCFRKLFLGGASLQLEQMPGKFVCWQENAASGTAQQGRIPIISRSNTIRVLGGGGVGEETLLQKGPSPTKHFKVNQV